MPRNAILYNPFAVPASGVRLFYPAGAALLAAMTAMTVAAALPDPWSTPGTPVALTSGGKFAARIPGLDAAAADGAGPSPVALPRADHAAADWFFLDAGTLRRSEVPSAKARLVPAGAGRRPRHRTDGRGAAGTIAAASMGALWSAGTQPFRPDDGIMHDVSSAAQAVWSVTASAGESLLSRLLPQ